MAVQLLRATGRPSAEQIIRLDSLSSSWPFEIDHPIGAPFNNPFFSDPNIRIDVQIDLVYFGLDNTEQSYHVRHDYPP